MKNKLTVNTIALGNLKQRKKQYTILIIGIVLAMVFSSATMFFISCTKTSNEEFKHRTMGNFYAYLFAHERIVDFEQGIKDGYVEKYGYAHILGYAYTDEKGIEQGTPVAWLDKDAKELYYPYFEEGRYPEAKGEIAIEKDAAFRLGINPGIGEEITLSMLTASGTDYLSGSSQKTYTVVGILTDKRKNIEKYKGKEWTPPMAAAFVCDEEEVDIGGKEILAVFFDATKKSLNEKVSYETPVGTYVYPSVFEHYFIEDIYDKLEASYGEDYNYSNLIYDVQSSSYDFNGDVANSAILSITLAVVLMLASCIGIVNAFSANLKERKKQIGMLRAVGATKRQTINIFGREAFLISLICVPVSVLISYFAVKLYARLMGDDFIFVPDFTVLIVTAAISVICVMSAALMPLLSASKISPMQAIRNVELSRKAKNKKIKSKMSFRVPDLIANRNIIFFRSKQVLVSIILVVTIIFSCFQFSAMMSNFYELHGIWYDYTLYTKAGSYNNNIVNYNLNTKLFSENDRADIIVSQRFSQVYGYKDCIANLIVDEYDDYMLFKSLSWNSGIYGQTTKGITKENFREKATAVYSEEFLSAQKNYGYDSLLFSMDLRGVDEDNLEQLNANVVEGKINIEKINKGEEVIICCPEEIGLYIDGESVIGYYNMAGYSDKTVFDIAETAERSFHAGDEITVSVVRAEKPGGEFVRTDKKVKIGAVVNDIEFGGIYGYYFVSDFIILTSCSAMENYAPGLGYNCFTLWGNGELNDEEDEKNTMLLEEISVGATDGYYRSEYAANEIQKKEIRMLISAMFAVIILFFAICGSVINNALTARIREGKKEIGTLRAVGADMKTIVKSYIKQLISMFGWGYGIGFGGYSLAHTVMKICEKTGVLPKSEMELQLWQVGIMCIVLFSVCAVNLIIKIRKEMKLSIVENIREL